MKAKVTVTLPQELLKAIDKHAKQEEKTRSDFIEAVVWMFIKQQTLSKQNARDLEIINRNVDSLNREASDVLEYALR